MPCYPALALLIGCAIAEGGAWIDWGARVMGAIAACACAAVCGLWYLGPQPSCFRAISQSALSHNPGAYTLSLGHMQDLTIDSFACCTRRCWSPVPRSRSASWAYFCGGAGAPVLRRPP